MKYELFAKSVIGPKYEEKGWPCQDYSNSLDGDGAQIIAVADGHGSNNSFRSQIGSELAVKLVIQKIDELCLDVPSDDSPAVFSETGINNLKYLIWDGWKGVVKQHWDKFINDKNSEKRYESVTEKYRNRYEAADNNIVERYLYTAYGTTLLVAVHTETQLLLLQIGDGTIVVLQRDGEFRTPIPIDETNDLNITSSLCEENAHMKIRHSVIDCNLDLPTCPIAVFLSSDGVDDLYPVYKNEEYLYKLYTKIIRKIIEDNWEETKREMNEETLPGIAAHSKDDSSLAMCIYIDGEMSVLKESYNNINDCYKPESGAIGGVT